MMRNFFPLMDAVPAGGPAGGGAATGATAAGAAVATAGAGAAATPPPAWHASFFKADGGIDHSAIERLPEAYKDLAPTLATLKTGEDLLGKIKNLNALAGRKGLAPLPANATPEDIAAQQTVLRAVLGVPEKAEGYAFAKPADLPDAAWDPAFAKEAQEILFKHNGAPGLAKDLLALQTKFVQGNISAQQQYEQEFYTAQDNEFREGLKKTGDDYDKVMNLVNLQAKAVGVPADSPLLKNATFRNVLLQFSKATSEASFKGGPGPGGDGTKSDRALAEAIVHDKTNPDYEAYHNGQHAKNAEVKKRVLALFESAVKQEQQAAAGGRR
jgi:hypothetical protein